MRVSAALLTVTVAALRPALRCPVRCAPQRVKPCAEAAPEYVDEAVAWAREQYPQSGLDVVDAGDGIVTSAIFWGAVDATKYEPSRDMVLLFDRANFPADKWAAMIAGLGIEGLSCEALDGAPLPAVRVATAWDEEELGLSDQQADEAVVSLKEWVQDVIVDSKVCPFTRSSEVAATGLEQTGVRPGPIEYPVCGAVGTSGAALARVMRAFWGSSIDLLQQPPEAASTTLLSCPAFAERDHDAFVKMTEAVVTTLKHVGAEKELSLVFFHPDYRRAVVEPRDTFTHGHLPPQAFLRAYVALTEGKDTAAELSEAQLARADAQRQAPFTMINILRSEQVEAAEAVVPWEVIEPEEGRRIRVSGARVYAKNVYRFATDSERKTSRDGYSYLVAGRKAREPEVAKETG